MAKNLEVEIANFVCRFGDELVLNDMLSEVVLPAFFSESIRELKTSSYFFTKQRFQYLDRKNIDSLALCCRIVKTTTLKRHQIFDPTTRVVVADERSMDSAPSSIAVLLLNSHRLLFVKEVPNAPTIYQFGSTFKHFMKNQVLDLQASEFDRAIADGNRTTRKSIKERYPLPDVRVRPVPSSENLTSFINRFDRLTSLQVEVATTNNELDNTEFFEDTREAKSQVGSAKTILTHRNSQGLDKKGCIAHVKGANQGNLLVKMVGIDKNGGELKGNNDDFSVKAPLDATQLSPENAQIRAYRRYRELRSEGSISDGVQHKSYEDKLREAFKMT